MAPSSPTTSPTPLASLIAYIEQRLCFYYQLRPCITANDFLLGSSELANFLADQGLAAQAVRASQEAGLWLFHDQADDTLFMGLHFAADVRSVLTTHPPLGPEGLCEANLDAFLVVVEEVSHFHLVRERGEHLRQVSRFELEWQAEVDKALLAATLLQEQIGTPALRPLLRKLYEDVVYVTTAARSLYEAANHYAYAFWRHSVNSGLGSHLSLLDERFLTFLRHNYHLPIGEKFPFTQAGQQLSSRVSLPRK